MKTKSDLYYLFKEDQEFKVNKISDELYGDNPQKKQEFDEKWNITTCSMIHLR